MYMYIYTRYIHIDIYALLYVVVIHVCLCTCVCAGRELNKDMLKEKAKVYVETNKDKINAKRSERITCECGCTSRRDKISQHKKSSCHQKLMEEKNKLKRNLTDEELDVFFRTNYPFQNYRSDYMGKIS